MGLSWTGTDKEAARVLARFFVNLDEAEELLDRAALSDMRGAMLICAGPDSHWSTLVSMLRAQHGSAGFDRLFHAALQLRPKLAEFLTAVGTAPPNYGTNDGIDSPRTVQMDSRDWTPRRFPLPSLGLSSKAPEYLESLRRDSDDDDGDRGGLESLPGDRDGAVPEASAVAPDEATAFTRDPVVTPLVPPLAGGPLVLAVDLARPAVEARERITVSNLPADWESLPIVVRATGVGVTFEAGGAEGVVLVRRNAASIACRLFGTIAADATRVRVAIAFFARDRYCGEIERELALDGTAQPAASAAVTGALIDPGIAAPDLTVIVRNLDPARPGLLHWDLWPAERHRTGAIAGLPRELSGEIDLKRDPRPWALQLFDTFAASDTGNLRILEGVGEELWAATPECFHQTYWALRAAAGEHFSIQFVCSEPFVPWEFLRPTRDTEALPMLMQNHPVARWMPAFAGAPRGSFTGKRIVTIASPNPSHTPPLRELQAAKAQSELLCKRFGAEPLRATYQDVMALLESKPDEPIAILHFAGHGAIDANPDSARIFLDDDPLTAVEVKRVRVQLGRAGRTLVFLNACSVGQEGRALCTPGGWPGALLASAFRGVVAPISKVWEREAEQFAQRFVALTWRDGLPISEALRQLRTDTESATPFAYIYYGDVMARFA